jgi:ribosomal protein S21
MQVTSKKFQGIVPGTPNAVKVNNGDLSTAIRIWKRQQKDSNIIQDLFDNKYYKKKSVKKREQRAIAKYNQMKDSENQKIG